MDCAGTTNAHDDNYWHYAIVGSREQGLSSTGDPQSTAAATRSRFCHFLQQTGRGETIYAPEDGHICMLSQGEAAGECSCVVELLERANLALAVRCSVEERIPQSLYVNEVRHAAVNRYTFVIQYAIIEKPE